MAGRNRDKYDRSLALTRQINAFRDGHGKLDALDAIISRRDVAISAKLEAVDIALARGILTSAELANIPPKPQPGEFGVSINVEADRGHRSTDEITQFAAVAGWVTSTLLSIWYLYDETADLGLSLSVGLLFGGTPFFILGLVTAGIFSLGHHLADRLLPSRIAKRRFDEALKSHSTLSLAGKIKAYESDVTLYQKASGREFERLVARAYSKAGYNVIEVGGSNDGGVDLIVSKAGVKAVVQCKAHARAISPAVVRELYGTLTHADATLAILASTNGPSVNAREWAKDKNIRFVSPDDLILLRL